MAGGVHHPVSFYSKDLQAHPFLKWRWVCLELPKVYGVSLDPWHVSALDLPLPKFNPEMVFGGGINRYYAGQVDYDQFTVRFYENVNFDATTYLTLWRDHIFIRNSGGHYTLPQDGSGNYSGQEGYKKNMKFGLLDIGPNEIIGEIELEQVWPVSVDNLNLDHEEDAHIMVSAQFAIDVPPTIDTNSRVGSGLTG